MSFSDDREKNKSALGIDRIYLRLGIVGTLVVACFVALFSRLWFLQVLASDDYKRLARDNRVRRVHTEPPRGRILDRNNVVLVKNRESLAVTIDRQIVRSRRREQQVLGNLSEVLDVTKKSLKDRLHDEAASPYKPVTVINDVPERKAVWILEHKQKMFPGVEVLGLPIRTFPQGNVAAHILGYVGEISELDLGSEHFMGVKPRYAPGDLVGKSGLEWFYDSSLRGTPGVEKVVVNSAGEVVQRSPIRAEQPGRDLVLSLDAKIQRLTERALRDGIQAARGAAYQAPAGGVVVMDPDNGQVLGMASYPTFDPSILADGISEKEFAGLEGAPDNPDDDALLNRAIQAPVPPGSTFKVVTAGAAMATGLANPYTYLDCPGVLVLPPEGGPGSVPFPNWTSADYGAIGFSESLEVSCDTFYYQLGWDLESAFGVSLESGDESERFQSYIRRAGFDRETGIDLANESEGEVPDQAWCEELFEATDGDTCAYGWLPGYTVNMAVGQGDLLVSPLQMAVTYAAIANGGKIVEPRLGMALGTTDDDGNEEILREFKPKVVGRLPLDEAELGVIHQGLIDVVSSDQGTAAGAFAGFPSDLYPIAGKTGTAQIGEQVELNRAWFLSYAPADDPRYVVAVYLEKAGHGGESAAPVARQVYEGLFGIDKKTEVQLAEDNSG
ncbi:penicillin-binding protein 2 [soil metagenome]